MTGYVPPPMRARDICIVNVYGDLDHATRVFRKQVQKARIISEIRDRCNYITRSERRNLKDQRALRRMRRSRKYSDKY